MEISGPKEENIRRIKRKISRGKIYFIKYEEKIFQEDAFLEEVIHYF